MIKIQDKYYNLEINYKKVKNIYLRVNGNTLVINCPRYVSREEIINFINDKQDWIIKNVYSRNIKNETSHLKIDSQIYYLGNKYDLFILEGTNKVKIEEDKITIYCKDANIENALKIFYKQSKNALQEIINERQTKYLNILNDYGYHNIPEYKFRVLKSAWGVCYTSKNLVVINEKLIHFQPIVIESVLWHELLHFIVPNHSKRFHQVLENIMPDYKAIQANLY